MKHVTTEKFIDLINTIIPQGNAGEKVETYSGRGMFNKWCVAVYTNSEHAVIAELMEKAYYRIEAEEKGTEAYDNAEKFLFELTKVLGRTRVDSMGREVVLYWPEFHVPE